MNRILAYRVLTSLIAAVWVVNGLVCKVLNVVPRHQLIVERILGQQHGRLLTASIGLGEVLLAVWILTFAQSRHCAVVQIGLVLAMNVIELIYAPDLLLFGRVNFLFALLFIAVVAGNEWVFKHR